MPKEFHRSERVSELIHRVISDVVRNELRDPRLRMVTITDLQLSRDLGVAKVYFTSLDDDTDLDEIEQVLAKVAGFVRSRVAREVRLRVAPELRFLKDEAEIRGQHMNQLIEGAVSHDHAHPVQSSESETTADPDNGPEHDPANKAEKDDGQNS